MDGARQVVAAVERRLGQDGAISFEELTELCLYGPEGGLYRRGCPPTGRQDGHYATCPRIDPALGEAIAQWLAEQRRERLGAPLRWHVIEVGGGDGSLAETVLDALPPTLRAGLTFTMVEASERALALQRERLGARVRWAATPAEALRRSRGAALLYSNELVDAFPAVVLERRSGSWAEVFVARGRDGRLVEELRPPGAWARDEAPLSVLDLGDVPEGSRAEAHPSYHRWLRSWLPAWREGAMLTVDYGASCVELYGRGGGGTLRAYYRSHRLEGSCEVLRRLGQQDLTCDVNFTDLAAWGVGLGLRTLGDWSQRELLERHGALRRGPERPGRRFVSDPLGAGSAFRALAQARSR